MLDPIHVKVNGYPKADDQFVAAGFEMFEIKDVAKAADLGNKYVLDAVMQQISAVCAPIVIGAVDTSGSDGILRFAVDRKGVVVAATLQAAIRALGTDKVALTWDATTLAPATFADMDGFTVTAVAATLI